MKRSRAFLSCRNSYPFLHLCNHDMEPFHDPYTRRDLLKEMKELKNIIIDLGLHAQHFFFFYFAFSFHFVSDGVLFIGA